MKTSEVMGILMNFLMGGTAVVGTSILGNFLNPLAGAIFWSYPLNLLPSIFFMKQNKKDNLYLSKFLVSTTFGLLLLGTTTFALSYFIRNSPDDSSLWHSIGKASIVYLFGAVIFYSVIKFGGLTHYFI